MQTDAQLRTAAWRVPLVVALGGVLLVMAGCQTPPPAATPAIRPEASARIAALEQRLGVVTQELQFLRAEVAAGRDPAAPSDSLGPLALAGEGLGIPARRLPSVPLPTDPPPAAAPVVIMPDPQRDAAQAEAPMMDAPPMDDSAMDDPMMMGTEPTELTPQQRFEAEMSMDEAQRMASGADIDPLIRQAATGAASPASPVGRPLGPPPAGFGTASGPSSLFTGGIAPEPEPVIQPVFDPEGVLALEPESFGLHLVSLGSRDAVDAAWAELTDRYADILRNLEYRIEEVDFGTQRGILYRVKAGPLPSEAAARRSCDQLVALGAYCVVTAFTGST